MSDKQSTDMNQAARIAADTRRRWEEVRQIREQVMSRQEQVIQQTRNDVKRQVERMRNVRASIIASHPPHHAPKATGTVVASTSTIVEAPAPKPTLQPIPNGPRFDFDARRVAWEQRRREQAEKRRADIERVNAPYQEQRRALEEKRRLALLEQEAARSRPSTGAHQLPADRRQLSAVKSPEPVVPSIQKPTQVSLFADDL